MPVHRGRPDVDAWHIVADPIALSAIDWSGSHHSGLTVIHIAADEVLAINAERPVIDDPEAIVERDTGWFMAEFDDFSDIAAHVEWSPDPLVGAVSQGAVAGVPAKVWSRHTGRWFIVVRTAYVDDLANRLGWQLEQDL